MPHTRWGIRGPGLSPPPYRARRGHEDRGRALGGVYWGHIEPPGTPMARFLPLALAALVLTAPAAAQLQFQQGSTITVEGTSSVQSWSCATSQLAGSAQAEVSGRTLSDLSGLRLTIPVQGLDCGNRQMNGKLREALGASTTPQIRYTVTGAEVGAPDGQGRFAVTVTGRLEMAGSARTVRTTARGVPAGDGRFRFTGRVPLKMSDYGIDPPTAMLGALRTGDEVTVVYDVTLGR
jgi:polyisoprenoid-binding protein YceI